MSGALKVEVEVSAEACCVCGQGSAELASPEEHDAGAPPHQPPLRAMLLHLNNNKVVPNGRLCPNCIHRTLDAYNFSTTLASKGPPPLSEKIRALRKRLQELTQKIDVFIVVGGGAEGAYSEQDIIMVERGALEAAARADAADAAREADARGDPVYQCTVCPLSFHRMCEYRAHVATHGADSVHTCWACGAQAASAGALRAHAASAHAPPAPLHCRLCDTTYQSAAELRAHHAACAPACPVCAAPQPSRAALRAHAARHAGLCPQCFVQCADDAALAAHALHHRQDRHFVCGYRACILRFHTRSNLLAHIRKCHGGAEPYPPSAPAPPPSAPAPPSPPPAHTCAHCDRTFGSAPALKRHARVHQTKITDTIDMEWTEDGEKVEYLEVETLDDLDPSADGHA